MKQFKCSSEEEEEKKKISYSGSKDKKVILKIWIVLSLRNETMKTEMNSTYNLHSPRVSDAMSTIPKRSQR